MFRRNERKAQRRPHWDPGIELQLQKIIGLQQRIAAKQALAGDYQCEIRNLHGDIRDLADTAAACPHVSDVCNSQIDGHRKHIRGLQQAIRELDAEVDSIHDAIATLQEKLNPEDLAFLGPEMPR